MQLTTEQRIFLVQKIYEAKKLSSSSRINDGV